MSVFRQRLLRDKNIPGFDLLQIERTHRLVTLLRAKVTSDRAPFVFCPANKRGHWLLIGTVRHSLNRKKLRVNYLQGQEKVLSAATRCLF